MSDREINSFLKILEKRKKTAEKHTKAQSLVFLHSIGIMTKNGNPTKRYKNICIPKDQA
jgi:hypothetical protein